MIALHLSEKAFLESLEARLYRLRENPIFIKRQHLINSKNFRILRYNLESAYDELKKYILNDEHGIAEEELSLKVSIERCEYNIRQEEKNLAKVRGFKSRLSRENAKRILSEISLDEPYIFIFYRLWRPLESYIEEKYEEPKDERTFEKVNLVYLRLRI